MKTIDLNADMGESFGSWTMGLDTMLLEYVSSANIACGWHAGDPTHMAATMHAAALANVAIGAHPGYPDLAGFGRRSMAFTEAETYGAVLYQIGAARIFAQASGSALTHVKAHGALYSDASVDPARARGIARAVKAAGENLYLLGLPGCELEKAAAKLEIPYAREFFADRAYDGQGRLLARSNPGALIHDADLAVRRTIAALETGFVDSICGAPVAVAFDTICLHGDNPQAVQFAQALRRGLESAGFAVAPFHHGASPIR